jgi:hypothetical protein
MPSHSPTDTKPSPSEHPLISLSKDPTATPLFPSIMSSQAPSEQSSYAPSSSPSESSIVLETDIKSPDELYGDEWW